MCMISEFESICEFQSVLKYLNDTGNIARTWLGGGYVNGEYIWYNSGVPINKNMFGAGYKPKMEGDRRVFIISDGPSKSVASPYAKLRWS